MSTVFLVNFQTRTINTVASFVPRGTLHVATECTSLALEALETKAGVKIVHLVSSVQAVQIARIVLLQSSQTNLVVVNVNRVRQEPSKNQTGPVVNSVLMAKSEQTVLCMNVIPVPRTPHLQSLDSKIIAMNANFDGTATTVFIVGSGPTIHPVAQTVD